MRVDGVTLLSQSTVREVAARYEGRCLTLTDINNLLRDISNIYIEKGYVTSRAFLPPEQTDEGTLRIMVIEGRIEKIIINEGDSDYYYRGRMAFPGLEGGPLCLWDIEQGLDQLNRLPSSRATVAMEPGASVGETVVRIAYPEERTWRIGLGMDNLGQRTTGQTQYSFSFTKDNFMGLGDQWAVYWTEAVKLSEHELFRSEKNYGDSNSFAGYFSIPYGYWTFSTNFSRYIYETTIYGGYTSYRHNGDTTLQSFQAEKIIHRDGQSKTSIASSFAHRENNVYIEREKLSAGSYKLSTFAGSLSHTRRMLNGIMNVSLTYTRGLNWLDSRSRGESPMDPHAKFDKYSTSLYWCRPFGTDEKRFAWTSSFYGQWSPQTLYNAERVQIGSRHTVRGFHESSIGGDKGGYLRNEISWNAPWPKVLSGDVLRGVQLYSSYDYGALVEDERDPFEKGEMHGVGFGLRTLGNLNADFCVGIPVKAPSYVKKRDYELYLSLTYTF